MLCLYFRLFELEPDAKNIFGFSKDEGASSRAGGEESKCYERSRRRHGQLNWILTPFADLCFICLFVVHAEPELGNPTTSIHRYVRTDVD